MADKIFRYFFSYTQYIEGQPPTFGNLCMDLPDRLMGYEDIARVQMMLEEDFSKKFKKKSQIIISNFQLML